MAETLPSKSDRKRERQPISVPFIWEEKPGTPKKDWKPTSRPIKPAAPPVKLVVSVPFGWEEKPGTPLKSFVQPPKEPKFALSQEQSNMFSSPQTYSDHEYGNWSGTERGNDDRDDKEVDGSSDKEIDRCSCNTDDSFISAQSLLANGLISTKALANAVPVQQTSLALTTTNSGPPQSPGSPASEADSTASSYATGTTSLVGASFLQRLFPLLAPKSSSPEWVGCMDKDPSRDADLPHGRNCSQVRRPLLTLGELIVMSRRRSCQRKVNEMHKQPSMDFTKRNAFGCCIFGSGIGISGLHMKWKRQYP
ncbi:hypothetical protein CDL12_15578 [Handroanthus impetiginosus]|uniref:Hydroxyproline-rich glycoprotein family protein n=1 Tax=Handroanthus impetiginosus TaxID=429701 RepID=A0A2G9H2U0_9LAMI|nr:hypothetical protein CDL12_15578 [Handroanthus impetiginosus]